MHSLGVFLAALNWGEPWHSELTQILPCGSWNRKKQRVTASKCSWEREREKVRGLQPAVWARPLEFTVAAILVTVPNMSLVKRDFLSSCSCKEREGLWTTAHQGTCLMKVTLSVLWTWENCKLSIYKWSLLNPILHECWNACNTYKAESYWLRNTGLKINGSYDSMCFTYTQRVAFKTLKQQTMWFIWLIHLYSEAQ